MAKSEAIEATEAYAFVNVVAPRLEQLRKRLVAAKDHLKSGDPETARLKSIVESQLAIKEFLTGITNLSALVEPIDMLLEAVREESVEQESEPLEPSAPAPPIPPPLSPQPAAAAKAQAPTDAWLRAGTAIAVERLTGAGMLVGSAETYVQQAYASVGLTQSDGAAISDETIRDWRRRFLAPGANAWRRKGGLKRRVGPPGGALADAKARVADLAATFKRIAHLTARGR